MQADLLEMPKILNGTTDRIRARTCSNLNNRIDQATMKRIWYYAGKPSEEISTQIRVLDLEWDLERFLECTFASSGLAGMILGLTVDRRWLTAPTLVLACLLQHSLIGTRQTILIFRHFGFRTRKEIDAEKYALKILRGDFDGINAVSEDTNRAIQALRLTRM